MTKCVICGKTVPTSRRVYCCDACAQEGVRRNARRDASKRPKCGVYRDAVCIDCGKPFYGHIKSKRCPDCTVVARTRASREYQQRVKAGAVRKLGSTDICERCGKQYIVEGGLQRYCPACAPVAVRENIIAARTAYSKEHYTSEDRASTKQASTAFALYAAKSLPAAHITQSIVAMPADTRANSRLGASTMTSAGKPGKKKKNNLHLGIDKGNGMW